MKNFITNLNIKRRMISALAGMHFFGDPSKKMKIVGVTGTNGKTTTTTLLYKIAKELGYKAGLVGTVENIIDGERMPTEFTTPEPPTLYRLLNKMAERGCEYVFMEVSSHGMDQNRVAGITFAGGIFTNLTHDHLDYHKTFENYFNAKKKFLKMLPRSSFALSNTDDIYGQKMLSGIDTNQFSYGFEKNAHFKGEILKSDFSGLELAFNDIPVRSKLLGTFNAYNLLAAWSASSLLGFDMGKVNKILEDIEPPRGRFQHFMSDEGVLAVVDYAHTPDAVEKILLAIKGIMKGTGHTGGKIISVFGCGGDRDPMKRKVMGKTGVTLSDIAVFTSDNPRSENPDHIIEAMKEGLTAEELKKIITIPNRREAIKEAVKIAHKGDIILCAGKGHEDYQEVKGVKHHFDDMEELKNAFQQI